MTKPGTPLIQAHFSGSFFYMKFNKPALTSKEHLELLSQRGLVIDDEHPFLCALNEIGYFRLSGYMFPFQSRDGKHLFQEGITSSKILRHYSFDKKLRICILASIETLEVAMRAAICNRTALEYDPHWYLDRHFFSNSVWHAELLEVIQKSVTEGHEQFIKSYRSKYEPTLPPIWMAMEVLSFGKLSSMFENMKDGDVKKLIAAKFAVHDTFLSSWLKSINFVRNCCAHHNRLWNRRLALKPVLPKQKRYRFLTHIDDQTDKQLFGILSCMLYLLKSIGQDAELRATIKTLFTDYPEINQRYMGFHAAWAEEPIWQS